MTSKSSVRQCLVIGATGLIGKVLVRKLLKRGFAVRALVRPTSDCEAIDREDVSFIFGDVRDPISLEAAMDGVDVVFSMAVPRHNSDENGYVLHRAADRSVVVDGAMNVARAVLDAGVQRLVHVSSAGVAGRARRGAISEETEPRPDRDYRINRLEAEERLQSFAKDRSLPLVIARLTHVYGPGDTSMEETFRLIARGEYTLWGDGTQFHHMSYVDDVAEGLIAVTDPEISTPNLYILGSRPKRLWPWLLLVADATGGRVRRHGWMGPLLRVGSAAYDALGCPADARYGITKKLDFHVNPVLYDISKSRKELDLPEDVSPDIAVARTADWYRKAGKL